MIRRMYVTFAPRMRAASSIGERFLAASSVFSRGLFQINIIIDIIISSSSSSSSFIIISIIIIMSSIITIIIIIIILLYYYPCCYIIIIIVISRILAASSGFVVRGPSSVKKWNQLIKWLMT